jgi:uncharacterized protein YcbK (DUF882 family)
MAVWSKLKHFNRWEAWGEPGKVNGLLLFLLDKITEEVKNYARQKYKVVTPCIIHCAYATGGHSPNSQHYKGNAADFHFKNIPAYEVYTIIQKALADYQVSDFVGLGVYPDWRIPGFHLDVRGYKARWSQVIGKYTDITRGAEILKEIQNV